MAALYIAGEGQPEPKQRERAAHRCPGAVSMGHVPLRGEQQGPALEKAPLALEELPDGNRPSLLIGVLGFSATDRNCSWKRVGYRV